ncbi:NADPH-dependent 2,4-dienoyl-CoA reductase/sulfur reductase-like enzyme [Nocardia kruczakiae]|uniref:NADPH-dependent 2,4-dienoyl-CoA reductase/sulfur reductase-like enzyme n=1 Tax=Nocardia kruczakiae TaxID=261477 RepID=A0ABU1X9T2_9NOCA|nr:FAD-dependent oxidoreductase [Nocardia kruczakiae]MDR7167302.1 NADPH-dependent 2,4-dienoyl-CoA reductase/sulfur reductase-like enzyme [Nocardia kruczakiae]
MELTAGGGGRLVVVGGGLAATRIVEEYRRLGGDGAISVVAAEQHLPYDRPPLTKAVLRGERDDSPLREEWSSLDVDIKLARRAVALRLGDRSVLLDDGEELGYESLVVANGATARTLPGLTGPRVHVVRSLDDALALRRDIAEHGRLTVVGGGFIGCEAAASARSMGAAVTLVETLPTPLARVLGTRVGAEVAALHERAGVELRCGTAVVEARSSRDGDRELLLSDGSVVDATVVLVGLGVIPDTGWLEGSGIAVDDGVLTDAVGRTSHPGVWSAGDVARWRDPRSGERVRVEHWTSAADQGKTVARDILGQGEPLDEVPYFWSDQYDRKLQMLGRPEPDDDVELMSVGPTGDRLLAVYGREGRFTGVVGASAPRWVMRMRDLLATEGSYDDALALAQS